MKKRIVSMLLALAMVLSLFPGTARAAELENGLQYEVYEDHVEITGYTGEATEVVVPDEIEGLPVTVIGDRAFDDYDSLTSITLPDTLSFIGEAAFNDCSNLSSIEIPTSVTYISDFAFANCDELTSIEFPNGVTYIGYNVCSSSDKLTSIKISASVTYICDDAFSSCGSLVEIYVDANNPNYSSDNRGVLFNKDKTTLIRTPEGIEGSYQIPDSVTCIGESAFADCDKLTSIEIPDSVTHICESAFTGCRKLTSIEIPASVCSISSTAFGWCWSLTGIHVNQNNPYYSSDDWGVLFNKEKTTLIRTPEDIADSYQIPDSVTCIGEYAFHNCDNLTSIKIPASVTHISDDAFANNNNLTAIELPDSLTHIGYSAFDSCPLTSIEIPASVTYIGDYAFSWCKSLTSIRFAGNAPEFAGSQWSEVFRMVTATAYYPAGNPTWTEDVMQDYGGEITWVPYGDVTPTNPFNDVATTDFYYEPVMWAMDMGITSGTAEGVFSPYDSCLRSQVVTFLWRAAGEPKAESKVNPFVDVKPTDYYYDAVLWAVEKGITTGADATHFEPNGVCNRSQVVTFLYRAFDKPPVDGAANPFTDVPTGAWYAAPVLWALKEGITTGTDDTHFEPNSVCNRSQVVTFLYRAYN